MPPHIKAITPAQRLRRLLGVQDKNHARVLQRHRHGVRVDALEPRVMLSADWMALPSALDKQQTFVVEPNFMPGQVGATFMPVIDGLSRQVQETKTNEVMFVDAGVQDSQQLVSDLLASRSNTESPTYMEVVVLDSASDGLNQIGQWLSQRSDIRAVHLISHGADGALQLGGTTLDTQTLGERSADVASWSKAMRAGADLLIYGCDVAQTAAGQSMLQRLASLTGADVAASMDVTGGAGQDWDLEFNTGAIEAGILSAAAYRATLAIAAADLKLGNDNADLNDNSKVSLQEQWGAALNGLESAMDKALSESLINQRLPGLGFSVNELLGLDSDDNTSESLKDWQLAATANTYFSTAGVGANLADLAKALQTRITSLTPYSVHMPWSVQVTSEVVRVDGVEQARLAIQISILTVKTLTQFQKGTAGAEGGLPVIANFDGSEMGSLSASLSAVLSARIEMSMSGLTSGAHGATYAFEGADSGTQAANLATTLVFDRFDLAVHAQSGATAEQSGFSFDLQAGIETRLRAADGSLGVTLADWLANENGNSNIRLDVQRQSSLVGQVPTGVGNADTTTLKTSTQGLIGIWDAGMLKAQAVGDVALNGAVRTAFTNILSGMAKLGSQIDGQSQLNRSLPMVDLNYTQLLTMNDGRTLGDVLAFKLAGGGNVLTDYLSRGSGQTLTGLIDRMRQYLSGTGDYAGIEALMSAELAASFLSTSGFSGSTATVRLNGILSRTFMARFGFNGQLDDVGLAFALGQGVPMLQTVNVNMAWAVGITDLSSLTTSTTSNISVNNLQVNVNAVGAGTANNLDAAVVVGTLDARLQGTLNFQTEAVTLLVNGGNALATAAIYSVAEINESLLDTNPGNDLSQVVSVTGTPQVYAAADLSLTGTFAGVTLNQLAGATPRIVAYHDVQQSVVTDPFADGNDPGTLSDALYNADWQAFTAVDSDTLRVSKQGFAGLQKFAAINATDFAQLLGDVGYFLEQLRQSDQFTTALPFTDTTLGEAVDFSKLMNELIETQFKEIVNSGVSGAERIAPVLTRDMGFTLKYQRQGDAYDTLIDVVVRAADTVGFTDVRQLAELIDKTIAKAMGGVMAYNGAGAATLPTGPTAEITEQVKGGLTVGDTVSNESQKIVLRASSGDYSVRLNGGQWSAPVAVHGSAKALQNALENLAGVGKGNVLVTGMGKSLTVEFTGDLAGKNIDLLQVRFEEGATAGGWLNVIASNFQTINTALWGQLNISESQPGTYSKLEIRPNAGVSLATVTGGSSTTQEVQRVTIVNGGGGSFALTGKFGTTAFTAEVSLGGVGSWEKRIQDAIRNSLKAAGMDGEIADKVTVSTPVLLLPSGVQSFDVKFGDNGNQDEMTVDFANMLGRMGVGVASYQVQAATPGVGNTAAKHEVQRLVFDNVGTGTFSLTLALQTKTVQTDDITWVTAAEAGSEAQAAAAMATELKAKILAILKQVDEALTDDQIRVTAVTNMATGSRAFDIEFIGTQGFGFCNCDSPGDTLFKGDLQGEDMPQFQVNSYRLTAQNANAGLDNLTALGFEAGGAELQQNQVTTFSSIMEVMARVQTYVNAHLPTGQTFDIDPRYNLADKRFEFDIKLVDQNLRSVGLSLPESVGDASDPTAPGVTEIVAEGTLDLTTEAVFKATIGIDFNKLLPFDVVASGLPTANIVAQKALTAASVSSAITLTAPSALEFDVNIDNQTFSVTVPASTATGGYLLSATTTSVDRLTTAIQYALDRVLIEPTSPLYALGAANLGALVKVGQVPQGSTGFKLKFTISGSIERFGVDAVSANMVDVLGFAATNLTYAGAPTTTVLPADGRLTTNAQFSFVFDVNAPAVEVTVLAVDTDTNTSRDDLVADINDAIKAKSVTTNAYLGTGGMGFTHLDQLVKAQLTVEREGMNDARVSLGFITQTSKIASMELRSAGDTNSASTQLGMIRSLSSQTRGAEIYLQNVNVSGKWSTQMYDPTPGVTTDNNLKYEGSASLGMLSLDFGSVLVNSEGAFSFELRDNPTLDTGTNIGRMNLNDLFDKVQVQSTQLGLGSDQIVKNKDITLVLPVIESGRLNADVALKIVIGEGSDVPMDLDVVVRKADTSTNALSVDDMSTANVNESGRPIDLANDVNAAIQDAVRAKLGELQTELTRVANLAATPNGGPRATAMATESYKTTLATYNAYKAWLTAMPVFVSATSIAKPSTDLNLSNPALDDTSNMLPVLVLKKIPNSPNAPAVNWKVSAGRLANEVITPIVYTNAAGVANTSPTAELTLAKLAANGWWLFEGGSVRESGKDVPSAAYALRDATTIVKLKVDNMAAVLAGDAPMALQSVIPPNGLGVYTPLKDVSWASVADQLGSLGDLFANLDGMGANGVLAQALPMLNTTLSELFNFDEAFAGVQERLATYEDVQLQDLKAMLMDVFGTTADKIRLNLERDSNGVTTGLRIQLPFNVNVDLTDRFQWLFDPQFRTLVSSLQFDADGDPDTPDTISGAAFLSNLLGAMTGMGDDKGNAPTRLLGTAKFQLDFGIDLSGTWKNGSGTTIPYAEVATSTNTPVTFNGSPRFGQVYLVDREESYTGINGTYLNLELDADTSGMAFDSNMGLFSARVSKGSLSLDIDAKVRIDSTEIVSGIEVNRTWLSDYKTLVDEASAASNARTRAPLTAPTLVDTTATNAVVTTVMLPQALTNGATALNLLNGTDVLQGTVLLQAGDSAASVAAQLSAEVRGLVNLSLVDVLNINLTPKVTGLTVINTSSTGPQAWLNKNGQLQIERGANFKLSYQFNDVTTDLLVPLTSSVIVWTPGTAVGTLTFNLLLALNQAETVAGKKYNNTINDKSNTFNGDLLMVTLAADNALVVRMPASWSVQLQDVQTLLVDLSRDGRFGLTLTDASTAVPATAAVPASGSTPAIPATAGTPASSVDVVIKTTANQTREQMKDALNAELIAKGVANGVQVQTVEVFAFDLPANVTLKGVDVADTSNGRVWLDTTNGLNVSGNSGYTLSFEAVTTSASNMTAPVLSSAVTSANGGTLVLTFNQRLGSQVPAASDFTVKVAGQTRAVQTVSVEGSQVLLKLASPAQAGQAVTVSYTQPTIQPAGTPAPPRVLDTAKALQGSTGLPIAAMSNQAVTMSIRDDQAPVLRGVTQNGSQLILFYSEALQSKGVDLRALAKGYVVQNTVAQTTTALAVSAAKIEGNRVVLTLATVPTGSVTVRETLPPAAQGDALVETVRGVTTVTQAYNGTLPTSGVDLAALARAYVVQGSNNATIAATSAKIENNKVVLVLASQPVGAVTLSNPWADFVTGASEVLTDLAGNSAQATPATTATLDTQAPTLRGVTQIGQQLTLHYTETLKTTGVNLAELAKAFVVQSTSGQTTTLDVVSAKIVYKTVVLTLASAPTGTVTVRENTPPVASGAPQLTTLQGVTRLTQAYTGTLPADVDLAALARAYVVQGTNNTAIAVTSAKIENNKVVLVLASAPTGSVTVSNPWADFVTGASELVSDLVGNRVAELQVSTVMAINALPAETQAATTGTADTQLPTLLNALTNEGGGQVQLVFSEALQADIDTAALATLFTLEQGGNKVNIGSVQIVGNVVNLRLQSNVQAGVAIELFYQPEASNPVSGNLAIQDLAGNDAVALGRLATTTLVALGHSVSNNVRAPVRLQFETATIAANATAAQIQTALNAALSDATSPRAYSHTSYGLTPLVVSQTQEAALMLMLKPGWSMDLMKGRDLAQEDIDAYRAARMAVDLDGDLKVKLPMSVVFSSGLAELAENAPEEMGLGDFVNPMPVGTLVAEFNDLGNWMAYKGGAAFTGSTTIDNNPNTISVRLAEAIPPDPNASGNGTGDAPVPEGTPVDKDFEDKLTQIQPDPYRILTGTGLLPGGTPPTVTPNTPLQPPAAPVFDIDMTLPNFKYWQDVAAQLIALSGADGCDPDEPENPGLLMLLRDPAMIVDTIDQILAQIQTQLNNLFGDISLPFIETQLAGAIGFIDELRVDLLGALREAIESTYKMYGGVDNALRMFMFDVLTTDMNGDWVIDSSDMEDEGYNLFLNFLRDFNGDGDITADDIVIEYLLTSDSEEPEETPETETLGNNEGPDSTSVDDTEYAVDMADLSWSAGRRAAWVTSGMNEAILAMQDQTETYTANDGEETEIDDAHAVFSVLQGQDYGDYKLLIKVPTLDANGNLTLDENGDPALTEISTKEIEFDATAEDIQLALVLALSVALPGIEITQDDIEVIELVHPDFDEEADPDTAPTLPLMYALRLSDSLNEKFAVYHELMFVPTTAATDTTPASPYVPLTSEQALTALIGFDYGDSCYTNHAGKVVLDASFDDSIEEMASVWTGTTSGQSEEDKQDAVRQEVRGSVLEAANAIQFRMNLGQSYEWGQDLSFDLGLDSIPLELSMTGELVLEVKWDVFLGFGIDLDEGFYLVTRSMDHAGIGAVTDINSADGYSDNEDDEHIANLWQVEEDEEDDSPINLNTFDQEQFLGMFDAPETPELPETEEIIISANVYLRGLDTDGDGEEDTPASLNGRLLFLGGQLTDLWTDTIKNTDAEDVEVSEDMAWGEDGKGSRTQLYAFFKIDITDGTGGDDEEEAAADEEAPAEDETPPADDAPKDDAATEDGDAPAEEAPADEPVDDGRLTFAKFMEADLTDLFETSWKALAQVNLNAKLGLSVGAPLDYLPTIQTEFHLYWGMGSEEAEEEQEDSKSQMAKLAEGLGFELPEGEEEPEYFDMFTSSPTVWFTDVRLDLGTFFTEFMMPIADRVFQVIGPLIPVIKALTTPIPGLSQLMGKDYTAVDLAVDMAKLFGGQTKIEFIVAVVKMVRTIIDMYEDVNSNGGNFAIPISEVLVLSAAENGDEDSDEKPEVEDKGDKEEALSDEEKDLPESGSAKDTTDDLEENADSPGSALAFPFLDDLFGTTIDLLLGNPVDLVTFTPPDLVVEVKFRFGAKIFFIFDVGIYGSLKFGARLTFGYDTYGIMKFIETKQVLDIFDGFYVSDNVVNGVDLPEIFLETKIGVYVGLDLGIVKIGIVGGIKLTGGINLCDPDKDGKIRPSEFIAMIQEDPAAIVSVEVTLGAFILFYIEVLFLKLEFTIVDVVLFKWEYNPCDRQPILAVMDGTDLVFNTGNGVGEIDGNAGIGQTAEDRRYRNTDDGNEQYTLTGSGGDIKIDAVLPNGQSYNQSFSGVQRVRGYAGAGNDRFDASGIDTPVYFVGGDGDDVLIGSRVDDVLISGTGTTLMQGRNGDDLLVARGGNTTMQGQNDNDTYRFLPGWGTANLPTDSNGRNVMDFSAQVQGVTVDDFAHEAFQGGNTVSWTPETTIDQMWGGQGNDRLDFSGNEDNLLVTVTGMHSSQLNVNSYSDTLMDRETGWTVENKTNAGWVTNAASGMPQTNLTAGTEQRSVVDQVGEGFKFVGFENIIGGQGSDVFRIRDGASVTGSLHGDTAQGIYKDGSGNENANARNTIDFSEYTESVRVDQENFSAFGVADASRIVVRGMHNMFGGEASDYLAGDGRNNLIVGNDGADTLEGRSAHDLLVADNFFTWMNVDGRPSNPTVVSSYISLEDVGLRADFGGDGRRWIWMGQSLENRSLTNAGQTLRGGTGNDIQMGALGGDVFNDGGTGEGNDTIVADLGRMMVDFNYRTPLYVESFGRRGGGNDTIYLGTGSNIVIGGAGDDTVSGNDQADSFNIVLGDNGAIKFQSEMTDVDTRLGPQYELENLTLRANLADANAPGYSNHMVEYILTEQDESPEDGRLGSAQSGQAGNDTINLSSGSGVVIGGWGADTITMSAKASVESNTRYIAGDHAELLGDTNGGIFSFRTLDTVRSNGGADLIQVGDQNDGAASSDVVSAATDKIPMVIGSAAVGEGGTAVFNVSLWQKTTPSTVNFTLSAVTAQADDFNAALVVKDSQGTVVAANQNGSYTVAPRTTAGAASWTVEVRTVRDATVEPSQTFRLSGQAQGMSQPVQATGTIYDINIGRNYVMAGMGADTVLISAGLDEAGVLRFGSASSEDVVVGDNGEMLRTQSVVGAELIPNLMLSLQTIQNDKGDADRIALAYGTKVVLGGVGGDTIDALNGDHLVLGDNGRLDYDSVADNGVLRTVTNTDIVIGGDDQITLGEGYTLVAGGKGNDVIEISATSAGNASGLAVRDDQGRLRYVAGVLGVAQLREATGPDAGAITMDNSGRTGRFVSGDNTVITFDDQGGLIAMLSTDPIAATGGADTIRIGVANTSAYDLGLQAVVGGMGSDQIDISQLAVSSDVLLGDNGDYRRASRIYGLTSVVSTRTEAGGADSIRTGAGDKILMGGFSDDVISAATLDDVLLAGTTQTKAVVNRSIALGDSGQVLFDLSGSEALAEVSSMSLSVGGNDTVSLGDGDVTFVGGYGNDNLTVTPSKINASAMRVAFGDNASLRFAGISDKSAQAENLVQAQTLDQTSATGGSDTMTVGRAGATMGQVMMFGGMSADTLTVLGSTADSVLVGDNGLVNVAQATAAPSVSGQQAMFWGNSQSGTGVSILSRVETLLPEQGTGDSLLTVNGNAVLVGGAGADRISAGRGQGVVFGDGAQVSYADGALREARSFGLASGLGDIIELGSGSSADSHKVVVGGAGADTVTLSSTQGTDESAAGRIERVVAGDNATLGFDAQGRLTNMDTPDADIATAGNDSLTVLISGNAVDRKADAVFMAGGLGDDRLVVNASGKTVTVASGDNLQMTRTSGNYNLQSAMVSQPSKGGNDTLRLGSGTVLAFGGVGNDQIDISSKAGDLVVAQGDAGYALFEVGTSQEWLSQIGTSLETVGGNDTLSIGSGRVMALGGAGRDTIALRAADNSQRVVQGDTGQIDLAEGQVKLVQSTQDDADALLNADTLVLPSDGQNLVIGGAGPDNLSAIVNTASRYMPGSGMLESTANGVQVVSVTVLGNPGEFGMRIDSEGVGSFPAIADDYELVRRDPAVGQSDGGSQTLELTLFGQGEVTVGQSLTSNGRIAYPALRSGLATFAPVLLVGTYGTLDLRKDGSWAYVLGLGNDVGYNAQSTEVHTETFYLQTTDGSVTTVVVNVKGDAKPLADWVTADAKEATGLANDVPGVVSLGHVSLSSGETFNGQAIKNLRTGDHPGDLGVLSIGRDGHYTYTLNDVLADELHEGQVVQENFNGLFTYTDTDGAERAGRVVVTVVGGNDRPQLTLGSDSVFTANVNAADVQTRSGSVRYEDVDMGDVLSLSSVVAAVLTEQGQEMPLSVAQRQLLLDAFAAQRVNDGGTPRLQGVINWTFAPTAATLAMIPTGQTVSIRFELVLQDALEAEHRIQVVVQAQGANEASSFGGNLSVEMMASDGQVTGLATVADADLDEDRFEAQVMQGKFGVLTVQADGRWTYVLNADVRVPPTATLTERFDLATRDAAGQGQRPVVNLFIKGPDMVISAVGNTPETFASQVPAVTSPMGTMFAGSSPAAGAQPLQVMPLGGAPVEVPLGSMSPYAAPVGPGVTLPGSAPQRAGSPSDPSLQSSEPQQPTVPATAPAAPEALAPSAQPAEQVAAETPDPEQTDTAALFDQLQDMADSGAAALSVIGMAAAMKMGKGQRIQWQAQKTAQPTRQRIQW